MRFDVVESYSDYLLAMRVGASAAKSACTRLVDDSRTAFAASIKPRVCAIAACHGRGASHLRRVVGNHHAVETITMQDGENAQSCLRRLHR